MSTTMTNHQCDVEAEHRARLLADLDRMDAQLELTGEFRILRRLRMRSTYGEPDGSRLHRGIYLDVETTGLDPTSDEIIEIAMVPFDFSADGRVFAVHDSFERFRDPGCPIPPAVTALTGITDAMLAGASVNPTEIEAFLARAVLVVAHNANFDRRFAERLCGAFAYLPWACSWSEIEWAGEGFTEGTKLQHLAAQAGFYFDGHRAVNDCRAGIELLSRPLTKCGRTALDLLLTSARTPRWRVAAVGAPFELRGRLKTRGYRWQSGDDGRLRAWVTEVTENALDEERTFLCGEIYGRQDAAFDVRRIDAFDRFSDRA